MQVTGFVIAIIDAIADTIDDPILVDQVATRVVGIIRITRGILHAAETPDSVDTLVVGETQVTGTIGIADRRDPIQCIVRVAGGDATRISRGQYITGLVHGVIGYPAVGAVALYPVAKAVVNVTRCQSFRIGYGFDTVAVVVAVTRHPAHRIDLLDQAIKRIVLMRRDKGIGLGDRNRIAIQVIGILLGLTALADRLQDPAQFVEDRVPCFPEEAAGITDIDPDVVALAVHCVLDSVAVRVPDGDKPSCSIILVIDITAVGRRDSRYLPGGIVFDAGDVSAIDSAADKAIARVIGQYGLDAIAIGNVGGLTRGIVARDLGNMAKRVGNGRNLATGATARAIMVGVAGHITDSGTRAIDR